MNQLPAALLRSLKNLPGFDKEAFENVHRSGEQITSVRINPNKIFNIQDSLFNPQLDSVPWSSNGYYLAQRPSFTLDPFFHAGVYYVQDASSMFLEEALRQSVDLSQPLKILDLCAAPGGKSTLIQSVISKDSLLVSNEVIKTRVTVLAENITKWGAANVIVTNNDPKDFQRLQNYFDVIVVDAPCSGSGLFRKDNEAIDEWSEQGVALCSQRQQRILADIMPALKEDGILIYATCSYSKEEDEEISDWLLDNYSLSPLRYQLKEEWGIVETSSSKHNGYAYRFYPGKIRGEGFFIAGFKKTSGLAGNSWQIKHRNKTTTLTGKETEIIKHYVKDISALSFIKLKEEIIALPKFLEADLLLIQSLLYIKKAGIKTGTIIRDELIPDHELAVSTIISNNVRVVDVDEVTALQYLRRAEIRLDVDIKGWALICFREVPLGWVKILPGRINNYYPKEWRILNK